MNGFDTPLFELDTVFHWPVVLKECVQVSNLHLQVKMHSRNSEDYNEIIVHLIFVWKYTAELVKCLKVVSVVSVILNEWTYEQKRDAHCGSAHEIRLDKCSFLLKRFNTVCWFVCVSLIIGFTSVCVCVCVWWECAMHFSFFTHSMRMHLHIYCEQYTVLHVKMTWLHLLEV